MDSGGMVRLCYLLASDAGLAPHGKMCSPGSSQPAASTNGVTYLLRSLTAIQGRFNDQGRESRLLSNIVRYLSWSRLASLTSHSTQPKKKSIGWLYLTFWDNNTFNFLGHPGPPLNGMFFQRFFASHLPSRSGLRFTLVNTHH